MRASERARLGASRLEALLDRAPALELPAGPRAAGLRTRSRCSAAASTTSFSKRASERVRSDFRDAGVTLAELVGPARADVVALELVDYAAVLDVPEPTWVAGALATLCRAASA